MQRSVHVFIFLAMLSAMLNAEQDGAIMPTAHNWGLQFKVDENLSIKDLQGLIISGQYFIRPRFAVRLGVDGGVNSSSSDWDESSYQQKTLDWKAAISAQALWYYGPKRALFYWGIGPWFSTMYNDNSIVSFSRTIDGSIRRWGTLKSVAMGVNAVAGAEYYLTARIAVMLEYGILFYQENQKVYLDDTPEWPSSLKAITSLPLKFGVAIYF